MGLIDWFRGLVGRLRRKDTPSGVIEREFGAHPAASRDMADNAALWYAMYINHPPWETCDVRPLGLPGAIGRELSRHALTEFSVTVSGSARAEYINRQVQTAKKGFRQNLELGLCLGGIALKPYPDGGRLLVEAYTSGFTPTRFDGMGRAVGGVFRGEPVRQGNEWYIKLEYHDFLLQEDGTAAYVVENKAYRSSQEGHVGAQVPLESVAQWADLSEREVIAGLTGPLFAYFKPPVSNDIEPSSPVGVSVYSGATVELIQQADEQWKQLRQEYRSGRRRMLFNGSVMDHDQVDDEFFEYGDFTSDTSFFQFINPELRDDQFYNGFQRILQRIEFNVGLAFGTFSDPQSVEKTATEQIMTKHRQYVTEDAIQEAFQDTLDGLVYAMSALCDLARLAPAGAYQVDYSWGDGVLDDPETRRQDMALDMQRVAAGLMRDVDFVMKWDKVDEETARKRLPGMEDMTDEERDEVE